MYMFSPFSLLSTSTSLVVLVVGSYVNRPSYLRFSTLFEKIRKVTYSRIMVYRWSSIYCLYDSGKGSFISFCFKMLTSPWIYEESKGIDWANNDNPTKQKQKVSFVLDIFLSFSLCICISFSMLNILSVKDFDVICRHNAFVC